MPSQFQNTPEALLGRNDSRNPVTTCKGITSAGRPCRRALAGPRMSPIGKKRSGSIESERGVVETELYCWQHKDQAQSSGAEESKGGKGKGKEERDTQLFPLQERSSIDTLVQRLGIASSDASSKKAPRRKKRPEQAGRPPRGSEPQDGGIRPNPRKDGGGKSNRPPRPPQKKGGFWSNLCCMTSSQDDDDYVEIIRHRKRVNQQPQPEMAPSPRSTTPSWAVHSQSQRPPDLRRQSRGASAPAKPPPPPFDRPNIPRHPSSQSQTTNLLSLIPPRLSPRTTSALLAELSKPISPTDEEGYIYIFWLTPQTQQTPSESTARSLLTSPPSRPTTHDRRISDVMTEYSYNASSDSNTLRTAKKPTIMLKIGRASNITRRLNEWQRQCGYSLNLVRWYPHIPSNTSPLPSPPASQSLYPDLTLPPTPTPAEAADVSVSKVRNVKRVERLVHLELADQRVLRSCEVCGREHREWFAVEACSAGVRGVDECVRRWVGWAAGNVNGNGVAM